MKYAGVAIDDWNWKHENVAVLMKISGEARNRMKKENKRTVDDIRNMYMAQAISSYIPNHLLLQDQMRGLGQNRIGGLFGNLLG